MIELSGRLMIDLLGAELLKEEHDLLRHPQVGGVILFARNCVDRKQIVELVSEIRRVAPQILIAVDQEGGKVQRFKEGFTRLPPIQKLGDLMVFDSVAGRSLAHEAGWLMASEVLACGVDLSFAPVLDVDRATSSIIGDRAFSDDPEIVCATAQAFIEGMHEAGMAATGKHFPGHGGVLADSHLEAPIDSRSMSALEGRDLVPFTKLARLLDGIMPAHMTFPSIASESVGFSSFWLRDILRERIGFDGVIFSDDLSMKGADVAGGYCDKARLALTAGCDMILVCNARSGAVEVLEDMQLQRISGSERVCTMRAKQHPNWNDLDASPRREMVISRLGEIAAR